MCGSLFHSPKVETPKVEKVAPAPQTVTSTETKAINDTAAKKEKRQRAAANTPGGSAQGSRIVANSLLGQVQSGTKSKLGD